MQMISDILLAAGAFGAAFYCYILQAKLKRFTTLENGMGSAIAVLSAQVDDMTRALDRARAAAVGSESSLEALTTRAESVSSQLALLVASMHDLPHQRADSSPAPNRTRVVRRRASREDGLMEAAE